jgi:hypothetical protein
LKNQRHEAFAKALFERSQTGAPPSSVMNSRRPMSSIRLPPRDPLTGTSR